MPEEASDFAAATVKRFKLDKLTIEKKSLKELLEKRDNEEAAAKAAEERKKAAEAKAAEVEAAEERKKAAEAISI